MPQEEPAAAAGRPGGGTADRSCGARCGSAWAPLLVFLFVFYVALPLLASHRDQVSALTHINVAYLALGVLLEIAALAAYAQLTHSVLPAGGPSRLRLFRINLSTLALSHVCPAAPPRGRPSATAC